MAPFVQRVNQANYVHWKNLSESSHVWRNDHLVTELTQREENRFQDEVCRMTLRHGDRQLIREWNEGLVLDIIRRFQPLTRTDIAARTGLGRSTVTVISSRLIRQGLVIESGSLESSDAGRRPVLLRLQARARSVIGVKLAPDRVTAGAADLQAEVCPTLMAPLPDADDPAAVLAAVTALVRQVIDQAPDEMGPAIGLGLVMPGVIDCKTGC